MSNRICRQCSTEFTPTKGGQKFCAKSCRDLARRGRYTQYYRDWRAKAGKPAIAFRNRRDRLRDIHGMTLDEFDALWVEQIGLCAICHNKLPLDPKVHVDHCHATGRIRGLLCRGCNVGLGNYKDDRTRLLNAASYLIAV